MSCDQYKHSGTLVATAILLQAVLLMYLSWRDSPTLNEVASLPAGVSHWDFASFELYKVNPPLVRMLAALPVLPLRPNREWRQFVRVPGVPAESLVGRDFINVNGQRSFWYFTVARWVCIPFALLGGFVCYLWAKELYGTGAGLMAIAIWTFAPTILANGHLITPDIAATSLGVTACYCFWRWLKRPSFSATLFCGLLLGLTQLTKFTWLVLFGLWPAIWVFWRIIGRKCNDTSQHPVGRRIVDLTGDALKLCTMFLLAVFVLNLGYGFQGSFKRLGDYEFVSKTLSGLSDWRTGDWDNRFSGTWLGQIPVPVPENYLLGIDMTKMAFEEKQPNYLRGEFNRNGWWYYYIYALAVKVPLGTWILLFFGCFSGLLRRRFPPGINRDKANEIGGSSEEEEAATINRPRKRRSTTTWRDELILLAPALVILVFVSANTGINRHMRYVLPAFPFAFVWMGRVLRNQESSDEMNPERRERRYKSATVRETCKAAISHPVRTMAIIALSWSIFSSLSVYPHSISYFNEFAGGPENGDTHLLGSDMEWGQDLFYLKEWLEQHPEAKPLGLAYAGGFDPVFAGIDHTLAPPGLPEHHEVISRPSSDYGPKPGWYAISVNLIHGTYWKLASGEGRGIWFEAPMYTYTYFMKFKPIAKAGYSIYIYHITLDEANRVRKQMGLLEIEL